MTAFCLVKPNRYDVYLIRADAPPMLYIKNLTEAAAKDWLPECAEKVFDGSGDALLICRSDQRWKFHRIAGGGVEKA